jgi:hypothetical protein
MIPGIWHCQLFVVNRTLSALSKQGVLQEREQESN